MAVKKVTLVKESKCVATVEVKLDIPSWPEWVFLLFVSQEAVLRPLAIPAVVCFFLLR